MTHEGVQQRITYPLCLHWAPYHYGWATSSCLERLWLECRYPQDLHSQLCLCGVTIALSYTFHLLLSPPHFCPLHLVDNCHFGRIKRWIFSYRCTYVSLKQLWNQNPWKLCLIHTYLRLIKYNDLGCCIYSIDRFALQKYLPCSWMSSFVS